MKKTLSITIALFVGTLLLANVAIASPLNMNRPLVLGDNGSEDNLQEVFDSVVTTGNIDAYNDQSDVALWSNAEAIVDTYLITLLSGNAGKLGVYSAATGTEVDLGNVDQMSFGINDAGDLYIEGSLEAVGFGNAFGFYWEDTIDGSISYTEDDKNAGGYGPDNNIMALSYLVPEGHKVYTQLNNGSTVTALGDNDWILAFEDQYNGDGDFQDAVYYVEDMDPVPEPATILLFGAGLLGLAAYGRKKGFRRS